MSTRTGCWTSSWPSKPRTAWGVLLGTGGGGLAPPVSYAVGAQPVAVAVGRVDEDSLLDIVAANSGADTVSVLLVSRAAVSARARITSSGRGPVPWRSATSMGMDGSISATAHQDLGRVSVLLNQGAGSFGEKKSYWVGSPDFVTFVDLNSDQDLDLVAVRDVHSIGVLLGQAGGAFGAVKPYHVASVPQQIATGDIDGDGSRTSQ
jgi:hypothetical protein